MKKYIVKLTQDERAGLQKLIGQEDALARKLTHARILLKADCLIWKTRVSVLSQ